MDKTTTINLNKLLVLVTLLPIFLTVFAYSGFLRLCLHHHHHNANLEFGICASDHESTKWANKFTQKGEWCKNTKCLTYLIT